MLLGNGSSSYFTVSVAFLTDVTDAEMVENLVPQNLGKIIFDFVTFLTAQH